ncbi:RNA polymerase sigma factor [Micromonospora sp. NPDC018662]|uniref:RNA polymerase sigma factor n=1 Tax=Micromonospora sp. NPDC018662 TaxID=3364238 RepID=UPI00378F3963
MHRAEAHERGQPEARPPDEPTDGELIRRSRTEPERFAPLFDRHAVAVHRYLARRIGPPADDLLAETFLVAFRRRAGYRPDVGVRPWLFGIATNLLRRHVRSEERRYRALARLSATESTPPVTEDAIDRLDAQALRRDLASALASLHRRDRDVLLLTAWADLSYEQIAAVLDVPVGTVRSRLHRARRLTRLALTVEEPT